MLEDLFARPDFLPEGGYLGFGLRFMYPLDIKKPVSVISGSLKVVTRCFKSCATSSAYSTPARYV